MNEILENASLIFPVLAAILVWIISFIISLRIKQKLDSKLTGRNEKITASYHKVSAVRREDAKEMSMQGNPIYEYGRNYFAHYDYEVNGKRYKYHLISRKFPTPKITLLYKDDPKKVFWMHDIPKPFWARPLRVLIPIMPFAAAVLTVWILLELTGVRII